MNRPAMNAVDYLRTRINATEACHCEPEYVPETQSMIVHKCEVCEALDRLARLVEAVKLCRDIVSVDDATMAGDELDDALAAVLGEGE